MTRLGGRNKLKRLAASSTYRMPRKHFKWVVSIVPGPHPKEMAFPIGVFLRDVLGIAKNLREVRYILRKSYVKVDHEDVRDYRYPLGLMDVVELVPDKKFYRILPGKKRFLEAYEILAKNEWYIKPLLIKNKVMVSGGRIQLTTHDARNFVFKKSSKFFSLKPNDAIIYDFTKRKVKDYVKFDVDMLALVYWGSKRGVVGRVREIKKTHPLKPKVVTLEVDGEVVETTSKYVFPIGGESPVIGLGGVSSE